MNNMPPSKPANTINTSSDKNSSIHETSNSMNVEETVAYVIEQHGKTNGLDKTGNTPYYWHLLRVMLRMKDASDKEKKIALLHDVLEDTHVCEKELREKFGDEITDGVIWCSKNFFIDYTFKEWMKKIGQEGTQEAILVKLSDAADNLGFERMRGLIPPKTIYGKKSRIPDVQRRIDKITRKKMSLRGEMGVYDRYYIGWNLLLENPRNAPLVERVHTQDFADLQQLKELAHYIPPHEFKNYLLLNKIHTWSIYGDIKLHHDRGGQPYLAADVNAFIGHLYQQFIDEKIGGAYTENQKKRDHRLFHITLINAAEYGHLRKSHTSEAILSFFSEASRSFYSYGVGSISKQENSTYYIILENSYISTIRHNLGLKPNDLHMTLGFDAKDVHGMRKNRDTVKFDNQQLWHHFIDNGFYPENECKNVKKIF